ncbi:acetoacetyl-CoA reductase [Halioxenophilus aromaticivorans]|uniref:Acetoacetyl-CoA reductase n=1 Tax=Halioxenophilus aromaticivorans TaxID=1306992 RepID=A0AAV3TWU5_9ALTE
MGRVAVVTGGTRGIGEAICLEMKAMGHQVIANYGGNDDAAKAFTEKTGIPAVKFDVADYDAVENGLTQIESDFGAIEIIVNNAGITRDGVLAKMNCDNWNAVLETNLKSCYNTCHKVVPGMRERGFGRIINISSVNGQQGQYGQVNYTAAKAGVLGFTKALALETAKYGITVNAIAPGYVDTEMVRAVPPEVLEKIIQKIPVGRLGNTGDIARAAGFLADERNSFITGSTLSINGGQFMAN